MLLRIAGGEEEAITWGSLATGRTRDVVREAAAFFVEQILLYPGADSYRVLGARSDASYDELRRNMTILVRWLHPDCGRREERAVFAARVTKAWDNLKTQERRAAYDRARSTSKRDKAVRQEKDQTRSNKFSVAGGRRIARGRGEPIHIDNRQGLLNRILMLIFGRTTWQ
jgi:curved DNA-binding protein CbpA